MVELSKRRMDVTASTFFRLLAVVVLVWMWLRLWQWILVFVAAVFLAISLDPLVTWLDGRGLRRRFGGPLVVLLLVATIVGFFSLSGASLTAQAGMLNQRIIEARDRIGAVIPDVMKRILSSGSSGGGGPEAEIAAGGGSEGMVVRVARVVVSGLTSILFAFVLTAYLLIDGRRTYEWFAAFAPPALRPRVHQTAEAARLAIVGYMRGTVATSVLAAIATLIVLSALKVPAPLLLALLAGILNFIPVVGLMLSLVPAVLLALTVSPTVAATVVAFYLGYNALENYYIQPKVYGHEMQLSGLAVLAAFVAGAELGGVIGALIALPIAAMYPPIESLWLKRRVGPSAVADHRRIEQTAEH